VKLDNTSKILQGLIVFAVCPHDARHKDLASNKKKDQILKKHNGIKIQDIFFCKPLGVFLAFHCW